MARLSKKTKGLRNKPGADALGAGTESVGVAPLLSPTPTSSQLVSPLESPGPGTRLVPGTPKAEDSPAVTSSRRSSFMANLRKRGDDSKDAAVSNSGDPKPTRSRRSSLADIGKALLGKHTDAAEQNTGSKLTPRKADGSELDSEINDAKLEEGEMPTVAAESRADRWKRRLSLSRDRSVERGAEVPKSPAAGPGSSPTNGSCESRADRWKRRLSLSKKEDETKEEQPEVEEGSPKKEGGESRVDRWRRRLSVSSRDGKREGNEELSAPKEGIATECLTQEVLAGSKQEETLPKEEAAESRADRWKRRLSLSRDRSVERGAEVPKSPAAGSGSSPTNGSCESRADCWKRRLSLSKKEDETKEEQPEVEEGSTKNEGGESRVDRWRRRLSVSSRDGKREGNEELSAPKEGIATECETQEVLAGSKQEETLPKAEAAESRADRWKRRLSLSRDRSVERGVEVPKSPAAGPGSSPTNGSCESRADRWKRRLSLSKKEDETKEEQPEVEEGSPKKEGGESRVDRWRRRLSVSSRDGKREGNEELLSPKEGITTECETKEVLAGSKPEETLSKAEAAESRADRWKRRLSLSRDRSVERGVEVPQSPAAGSGSSPTNGSCESRADRWKRRLSLSKKNEDRKQDGESHDELSPRTNNSESRADRWKRRLSLSRDRSTERGSEVPKSPQAEEGSRLGNFLRRLSASSREGRQSETEDEEKESRLGRLRKRLSHSKAGDEDDGNSEGETDKRGRRLLRRLSIGSRKSGKGDDESDTGAESKVDKWKRRLSISSRNSRMASREGSVCSVGDADKEGSSWRTKLSVRGRSREPPLPGAAAGPQTGFRASLREKAKRLVGRRDSRAEDMERVERFHNPDYKPTGNESAFEDDFGREADEESDGFQVKPDLAEAFAVSSESSRVASVQPNEDLTPRFTAEPHRDSSGLHTPTDILDWVEGGEELDEGVHLVDHGAKEEPLSDRSEETEYKRPSKGLASYLCCSVGPEKAAADLPGTRAGGRCERMRPREKIFFSQPIVCRELTDDDFGAVPRLCYAPTDYGLEIEKAV